MSEWKKLEKDLCTWLKLLSTNELVYRNPNQAIIGFPPDGFRSDGMITDGRVLVAIEVEAGQMHPDTNVGKYWLLYNKYRKYEKIILFHIYTPDYNSYGWRKKLAEFYAGKMRAELPFEYILMDYRSSKDYDETLDTIKESIMGFLKNEFEQLQS
ncbi:hypothetical protein ACFLUO_02065 [Chloroflexota bacterium]